MIARIRDRDAFLRLRREGVRVRNGALWCSTVADPTIRPPQVAFAFGRAVGSAVTRNRLRRRLRALLATRDLAPGLYLFGGRPPAGELTFAQLDVSVAALLDAAHRSRASE